uniref:PH domain-containing protein n=1 Tax=Chromera velia CCMP2878 TaxID=1169474 RepID=A0A0G4F0S0_9ALVE|eukprot:Cvel_14514.t1-p1 / transcript=Cvel_14514.t1 / gene=Cvel_14514 / organism=Chromera_velia_CCMP2878 / gene_product=Oxysterol-binding protein 9, putative / transcript_product=Oxysterol-binding protein 9, putative / location=Cvel_scaffold1036:25154-32890(+) / protein_length=1236 / sequence_SO=supercontig / SO=protein_coding / is_pseudo=false
MESGKEFPSFVSPAVTPALDRPCDGYLWKLGDGFFNNYWSERYVVVFAGFLFYFDSIHDENAKVTINLQQAEIEWIGAHRGRGNVFLLKSPHHSREVHLAAETEDSSRQWIDLMQRASAAAAEPEASPSPQMSQSALSSPHRPLSTLGPPSLSLDWLSQKASLRDTQPLRRWSTQKTSGSSLSLASSALSVVEAAPASTAVTPPNQADDPVAPAVARAARDVVSRAQRLMETKTRGWMERRNSFRGTGPGLTDPWPPPCISREIGEEAGVLHCVASGYLVNPSLVGKPLGGKPPEEGLSLVGRMMSCLGGLVISLVSFLLPCVAGVVLFFLVDAWMEEHPDRDWAALWQKYKRVATQSGDWAGPQGGRWPRWRSICGIRLHTAWGALIEHFVSWRFSFSDLGTLLGLGLLVLLVAVGLWGLLQILCPCRRRGRRGESALPRERGDLMSSGASGAEVLFAATDVQVSVAHLASVVASLQRRKELLLGLLSVDKASLARDSRDESEERSGVTRERKRSLSGEDGEAKTGVGVSKRVWSRDFAVVDVVERHERRPHGGGTSFASPHRFTRAYRRLTIRDRESVDGGGCFFIVSLPMEMDTGGMRGAPGRGSGHGGSLGSSPRRRRNRGVHGGPGGSVFSLEGVCPLPLTKIATPSDDNPVEVFVCQSSRSDRTASELCYMATGTFRGRGGLGGSGLFVGGAGSGEMGGVGASLPASLAASFVAIRAFAENSEGSPYYVSSLEREHRPPHSVLRPSLSRKDSPRKLLVAQPSNSPALGSQLWILPGTDRGSAPPSESLTAPSPAAHAAACAAAPSVEVNEGGESSRSDPSGRGGRASVLRIEKRRGSTGRSPSMLGVDHHLTSQGPSRERSRGLLSSSQALAEGGDLEWPLHGFERVSHYGGLKLIDQDLLDKQKGVASDMLRQAASLIAQARPLTQISLPVRVFEGRSLLQRVADLWGFGPAFLPLAARYTDTDPLERAKLCLCFLLAGLHKGTQQLKPFNPLLGETFQGTWSDGTKVCLEHTRHHPPVCHFQVDSPRGGYQMDGHYKLLMKLGTNAGLGFQEGPTKIRFRDGATVTLTWPAMRLSGILYGSRIFEWVGEATVTDEKNGIFGSVRFGETTADGKGGGSVFSPPALPSEEIRGKVEDSKNGTSSQLTGSWLDLVEFDGQKYWGIYDSGFEEAVPVSAAESLPSDCRWRPDIFFLRNGDLDLSQKWKHWVEDRQREDRSLRATNAKLEGSG